MKAYCTYPAPDPQDEGCCLVFAHNRNQARYIGLHAIPWFCDDYINMRAFRAKDFDKFSSGNVPYAIDTNAGLPEGAPDFYLNE